jgi:hypothetical protein
MKSIQAVILPLIASLLLAACGGGAREVRITEGSETIGSSPTGTVFATQNATIVHVNKRARMATIINGDAFDKGAFLIVTDREGNEKGVLKALSRRSERLRTADILEGIPSINDTARPADSSETARLERLYPDPAE